ncbi:tRNA (adenosine(37)-N6)-threonylcarbamoyltransferase complex dimerization subunit type 1 TsaB [Mycoplasma cottewii]|uniref:tRNA (Adenosine(37)-N6)-threonylcarbamoyltransferase complex dimerization subunit type 1 TsaB n=1 Tax=Mycoplasma cottewii TaxID=51364 RepID=A0ABY5TXJ4_9MOLU|nr:tRNA (adenosine(37)-N6)-threonylcarbamoyltransferase complex dimerization subunit type 1 TsaB [Mycoplasma cottewii]UWD34726.1 tRNA (adenosine(37)-N6)-threonylcarbamoyltransferase complex dimerization subunit type 1 TsaB [Mycoplasma cottewii]
MNLFIDTTNWKLVYILEKNNEIVDKLIVDNNKKISDIAIEKLKEFLTNNNLTIKDIDSFYLTKGPGSYTGVRVGLTIVKTIKVLNNNIKVYLIDSLMFQSGKNKAISILDARGHKYYFAVYDQFKILENVQLIEADRLDFYIKKYKDFKLVKDYEIDFANTYLETKEMFELVDDINSINPLYVKGFI